MTQTVLVTGGSGFIAGWCIAQLLDQGYAVRATVRSDDKADIVRQTVGRTGADLSRLSFAIADLTQDAGWDEATQGCDYVLHVASPLGRDTQDLEALVRPARDGTIRVLKAAKGANVKRVVVTSSCGAATPRDTTGAVDVDETTWTDPNDPNLDNYRRSKAVAERAAWDWMAENDDPARMTTVLPAAVFGPILSREAMSSVALIEGLLNGHPPMTPRVGFNVVDVRDVAELHIRAMTMPDAAGQRLIAAGERMWMGDVAAILRRRLGERAAKVPKRNMPGWLVRLMARFVPLMKPLVPMIGRQISFSSAKAQAMTGWRPRPGAATIVECAESLSA
ncbi:SDR family oxidoreductase [Brevundimonas aveniformis]|uniref:SDR family oxidoreductase n=1 Tax=Brevundimonas aveniformis TaxID=370977 RepID=UPI0003FFE06D|nr:aldehyde reductase [Brevundimonas aveniformis]